MADANDSFLLREYAERQSESAFSELVRRHVNFVYSVAMRYVGNSPDAEDVAQAVFGILAKKSARLCGRTTLTGWLYETTRLTARQLLRTKTRRLAREQEAYMQSPFNPSGGDPLWHQLAPHLEDAMSRLRAADRELLALRFYENKSGAEAAALLGIGAAAAHKRTNRALEKLRAFFETQGISTSTGAISGAIVANAPQTAPAGLAKTISAIALTKGAATSASTLTYGALKIMAWTKAKTTGMAIVIGILLAAGTTTVAVREIHTYTMDNSWRTRSVEQKRLNTVSAQVRILPSKYIPYGGWTIRNGKIMGVAETPMTVIQAAYDFNGLEDRVVSETNLDYGSYDFIASLPNGNSEALQAAVKRRFGLVAKVETIDTNVLLLMVKNPHAPGLKPSRKRFDTMSLGDGRITSRGMPISELTPLIELYFYVPVIDRTGLRGKYDYDFKYDEEWDSKLRKHITGPFRQALLDQLGFELVPTNMPVEMLMVEKAQ